MHPPKPADGPDGRHEEFVGLLTASHDKLLGYLLSLLGRWHDAQDVLQRASVLMWRKFDSFESGTDFTAWASTICFYEAKYFQRTASRSAAHFDEDLIALLAAERTEDLRRHEGRRAALEACLGALREEDRRLLETSCAEHGDIAELAAQMGRAPRTLYNKLALLRRLLADCVLRRSQEETA
ncbi:MAG: sigma-70 family RNA polymerase sigma factor [Opitutaceae bacterium]|nr:sigma-70 family RNA polymerase sigma factor [Opitutaceae bacterium]